jgi:hypothetical protein
VWHASAEELELDNLVVEGVVGARALEVVGRGDVDVGTLAVDLLVAAQEEGLAKIVGFFVVTAGLREVHEGGGRAHLAELRDLHTRVEGRTLLLLTREEIEHGFRSAPGRPCRV